MAFHNPNLDPPTLPKSSNNKLGTKLPFPEDAAKETAFESMLAHRKNALNSLFDRTNLLPVHDSAPETISVGGGPKGKGKSARGLLEKYDAVQKKVKKKEGSVDLAVAEGLDSEEGIDGDGELIDQNALNLVYSKAKKNDAFLPEMDPPSSFKLELRQYQKQALRWMSGMEGIENEGEGGEGREVSMHPLWEEYRFPASDDTFYYNPYSGELSLEFPRASKKCRGGILADGQYSLSSARHYSDDSVRCRDGIGQDDHDLRSDRNEYRPSRKRNHPFLTDRINPRPLRLLLRRGSKTAHPLLESPSNPSRTINRLLPRPEETQENPPSNPRRRANDLT